MGGLLADLRHAVRLYAKSPVPSLIAVAVLAVGMAFVGAFLSLYVDLVLRPHPGFDDSGDIVTISQVDGTRFTGIPFVLIERMANEMSSLEAVAGSTTLAIPQGEEGEIVWVELVTADFFAGLRPRLALGRGLEASDHAADAEPAVVISDRFWREQLDASPEIVGRTVDFVLPQSTLADGAEAEIVPLRVVGIMAPQMRGLLTDQVGYWAAFERIFPMLFSGGTPGTQPMLHRQTLRTFGRLSQGASPAAAAREIESRYPEPIDGIGLIPSLRPAAVRGIVRDINVHRDAERQLALFLAGSVLLALVAAANVSLFLLARAPGRRRELAIRMSVGAPGKRLARQLASEAGLLVLVGAGLGLVTSIWLVNFLQGLAFLREAEWDQVTLLDWRVLGLVAGFMLLLTLLVSLAPILGLKRLGIAGASRQIAARATLGQRIAGAVQIAIAGMLGGAAVAFGWYLASLTLGHPGYETADRHFVRFNLEFMPAPDGGMQVLALSPARDRGILEAMPGVNAVTLTSLAPAAQESMSTTNAPDPEDPAGQITLGYASIDSAFVDVLGLRLLYGRAPGENETGVALVNQALARRVFGRDNVVGEFLDAGNVAGGRLQIIGVLEDLSFLHPGAEVDPIVFASYSQSTVVSGGVIETPLSAAELQQRLQALIDAGELEVGQPFVTPLSELRRDVLAPDQARSLLTITTATLVVLLAAFGFYGTQRYLVAAGRREYAIRASLGAGPKALGRLVIGRGIMLGLPGLAAGGLLAFIVVAWLRDDFTSREIPPGTVTMAVVAGLILLLAAASLGPARQARRTQPAPLLREE